MSINTNRSSPTQINTSTNSYQMTPKSVGVSFKSISVGPSHVLAIKSNGTLWTWGYNNLGQLGDSTTINKSSPIQLGSDNYIQIHADLDYSFALRSDYILFGWGYNQSGQLGTNITIGGYVSSPVQINSTSWNSVSSGSNHLVALKSDNTLWSWGLNTSGQLGDISYINRSSPAQIGTNSYVSVSSGDNYTLALTNDYKVVAFGDNTYGQLGYTTVSDIKSWTMMSGNDEFTLAIRTDGLLFVWGINTNGQLGLNDRITRSSPTQLGTNSWSLVSVEGGSSAIRSDGTLWSWGLNSSGQLGDNTTINRSSPVQVAISGSWSNVSAGLAHKLAIANDGTLYTWGLGTSGQLGNSAIISRSSPIQISTSSYILISTSDTSSYAITFDGKLFSWGAGTNGRLGLNDTLNRSSPVQVGSSSWSFISATRPGFVFAIKNNLKLYAWGLNTNSSLGTNDAITRSSPVQIHSNDWRTTTNSITGNAGTVNNGFGIQTDYSLWGWGGKSILLGSEFANSVFTYSWTQISSGDSHTVAIRSDGRMFAWGLNVAGQVGNNSTISRSSPTQIGTSQDEGEFWYNVCATGSRTVAIRCDYTLWVWGLNSGYVGLSDSINRSSPVQITTIPALSYTQISAGIEHTFALTNTGLLYVWGNNNAYQLGFDDGIARSTPVQLSGSFTQVAAGNSHSLVVDSNNQLYAWGDNTVGQIGNSSISNKFWVNIYATIVNSTNTIFGLFSTGALYSWGTDINGTFGTNESGTTRSVPVQIGSSSWNMVAGGRYHVLAIDSTGRLFAWGSNTSGEAGDAYPIGTYSSSPVQLGTDSWSLITAGQGYSAGIKTNGLLYTWGSGSDGVLGFNNAINRSSPTQLGTDSWSQVSAGTGNVNNLMALRSDYSLFAWGTGANGQLGIGLTTSRSSPVQVQSGFKFKSVASGFGASFAIRDNYTLWSWGGNTVGILGLNIANTVFRSSPVQIGVETYKQISVGSSNVAAVRTNGSLLVWGLGQQGQIGNNTTVNRSSPVQVGTLLYDWVSSAGLTIFASLANTKLPNFYAWGQVIENGTGVSRSSPVQVFASSMSQFVSSPTQIGSSSWSSISAGASHSLGINSTGLLYAWGDNTFGQLATIQSATAIALPNSNGTGYINNTDNTLYLWGSNNGGQLGDGTTVNKSTITNINLQLGIKFKDYTQSRANTNMYTLAISTDNKLWAWGYNGQGNLGIGDIVNRSLPVQIGNSSWVSIASNFSHSIAVKSDNTLWGWGAAPMAGNLSWQQVSAGASHTLILRSDKQLFGFGSNTIGQLGDNTIVTKSSPTLLHTGFLYNSVAAGVNVSAGIREDNSLWTWGTNTNGALGLRDVINRSSPVQVGSDLNWSSVAVAEHMIAEKIDGTVYAWGTNAQGQLGLNDTVSRSSPVQVSGSWTSISAGLSYSSGISSSRLYAWGSNSNGKLGLGDTINRSSPVQIGSSSWSAISTGDFHALGITTDGSLFSWGLNTTLQLGLNVSDTIARSSPTQIGTSSWTSVAAGSSHSTAIDSIGRLFTWGASNVGQTGLASTVNRSSPTQVGTSSWSVISAGGSRTVALLSEPWQNLYTWGAGTLGSTGTNDTINRSSPVQIASSVLSVQRSSPTQISGTSDWSVVASAFNASYALKTNGTLWTWGAGTDGKLGLGDTINRSSPTQIGTSSWSVISGGHSHATAITVDGALYAWGGNGAGQLGLTDILSRSEPVQVSGSYTKVSAGTSHTVAITTDNLLLAWGYNANGQLGLSDTISRSSPVQIDTTVVFTTLIAGFDSSYGFLDDIFYGWGLNTSGQLALGDTVARSSPTQITAIYYSGYSQSSPTQVGAGLSWNKIIAGPNTSVALESTGELFTWGLNTSGQLGNTSTISRSSIVQIGTSSYTIIAAGGVNSYAIKPTTNLLFGWGLAASLGDNTGISKSSPVQIASGTNTSPIIPIKLSTFAGSSYTQVQSTSSAVTVTASNGLLYAWGNNNNGKLGILSVNVTASSPILIGGQAQSYNGNPTQVDSNSYTQISAGNKHALAIKNNSMLYGWGNFAGTAPAINAYSWKKVSAGGTHFVAIRGDGTLWVWGQNLFGQLGTNDIVNRSVPVQISGTYIDITAGYFSTAAITSENNLYTWGANSSGQLGLGNTISRSSPVQVGTSLITSPTAYSALFDGTAFITAVGSGTIVRTSGSFTIEGWYYPTSSVSSFRAVYSSGTGYATAGRLYQNNTTLTFYWFNAGGITGSIGWTLNTWNHFAVTWDGTTTKVYVNGQQSISSTSPTYSGTVDLSIGESTYLPVGYISNFRIVNSVVYSTAFTPSASPLTAISGTILLTCQNKTIIDNSSNALALTGSALAGQLESPFVGYSVALNTSQYLTVGPDSAFGLETGDFTIECWIYLSLGSAQLTSGYYAVMSQYPSNTAGSWSIELNFSAGPTNQFTIYYNGNISFPSTNTSLSANTWYHLALVRSGSGSNNLVFYVNGINSGSTTFTSTFGKSVTYPLYIGAQQLSIGGTWSSSGYISNVRIVKGTAMYTSNFTPVAYNLANVSGTSLLTCQSSTIVDNSSNNFAITNNGTALTTYTETPITYNANGLLFGGTTSDYLTIPSNASLSLTGDFTIEAWIYFTSEPTANEAAVIQNASQGTYASTGSWFISWLNGGFYISHRAGGTKRCNTNSLGSVQINTWYHIAFTRTLLSGAQYTLRSFLNGTFADAVNVNEVFSGSTGLIIGNQWVNNVSINYPFPGYISNLRVINGTSLYTSNTNFTPSTSPLTAITNTVLLTCQHPAAIDSSSLVNPITVNGSVTETPSGITPFTNYLASVSGFSKIVAGYSHSLALGTDKKLYVWGGNSTGQLGTNNVTTVLTPTQITPTLFYNDITAAGGHSGAIDTNQNLYTWGLNTSGQLGINVTTNRSSPTQLGSFKWSSVVAMGPVSTGIDSTIAIRNDGTLWSWGGNTNGQLGNTTTISRSSPVQIGSGIWSTLYNNNNNQGSVIAQQSNGSLFVWGVNDLGQLGINATTNRSSPVQLSTSFNFANSGSIGSTTGAFFDVTGQLYTAGRGTSGELGDGNIAASQARSTPVQIATYYPSSPIQLSSSSWSQISAGNDLSYSVDTTGTLYAWGLNTSYQTGIGTGQTIVSSPTQVGTAINSATAGSTTGGYIKNV